MVCIPKAKSPISLGIKDNLQKKKKFLTINNTKLYILIGE